ncbi:hypothetical protein RvY_05927 [Ramazzottius varieornatus]|uniref:Uncharacterized protein n=1 Tax=Ramazzottius varieornatus TaxID=947166 RepID=A0A1D1V0B7_RAMVA|nr:hypothetical protein RvY_05927 [Ramazzottius varieornatus]
MKFGDWDWQGSKDTARSRWTPVEASFYPADIVFEFKNGCIVQTISIFLAIGSDVFYAIFHRRPMADPALTKVAILNYFTAVFKRSSTSFTRMNCPMALSTQRN